MTTASAKFKAVTTDQHRFPIGVERDILAKVDCTLVPSVCKNEEDTIAQRALYQALKEGWIAGAGLDVLEQEPPDPDDPILTLENVVFTPHYASYTEEAYHELRVKTAENAAAVLQGRLPKYLVNPEVKAKARLLRRH